MGPASFHEPTGRRPGPGCRNRRCLLKGCEQPFTPSHPQVRYCSEACRRAAERWRRVKASRQYRASVDGREQRRRQNRQYRQRRREKATAPAAPTEVLVGREGKRPAASSENFAGRMCARPGCYVVFAVEHEHSPRRFCSTACCLALRRVLDREARYRRRRRRWRRERRCLCPPRGDTS